MKKQTYENENFLLVSGCAIIDKKTGNYLGAVCKGGVEWAQPDERTKLAVSAFVGECAMNGISFNPRGGAEQFDTETEVQETEK
jgi:hypothetical protein